MIIASPLEYLAAFAIVLALGLVLGIALASLCLLWVRSMRSQPAAVDACT